MKNFLEKIKVWVGANKAASIIIAVVVALGVIRMRKRANSYRTSASR